MEALLLVNLVLMVPSAQVQLVSVLIAHKDLNQMQKRQLVFNVGLVL